MPRKSLEEAYTECKRDALLFRKDSIDEDRIRSQLQLASEDLESARTLHTQKKSNSSFKLLYDAFHTLAEAMAALDKVKSYNHQCLFAHLCMKHPQLNWKVLEKARKMRNKLHYDGKRIGEQEWKENRTALTSHCENLRQVIKERFRTNAQTENH